MSLIPCSIQMRSDDSPGGARKTDEEASAVEALEDPLAQPAVADEESFANASRAFPKPWPRRHPTPLGPAIGTRCGAAAACGGASGSADFGDAG